MTHSKSSLFLMELIASILFFSIASAVCIQLFVKSHLLSKQSVDANHAVVQAQNLAECWLATNGDLQAMAAFFPDGLFVPAQLRDISLSGDSISLYFDGDWTTCGPQDAAYCAKLLDTTLWQESDSGLLTARIQIYCIPQAGDAMTPESTIYDLTLSQHLRTPLSAIMTNQEVTP